MIEMAEGKKKYTVGSFFNMPNGVNTITRPDGEEVRVTGGLYVLQMSGTYKAGDEEVEVK